MRNLQLARRIRTWTLYLLILNSWAILCRLYGYIDLPWPLLLLPAGIVFAYWALVLTIAFLVWLVWLARKIDQEHQEQENQKKFRSEEEWR